MREFIGKQLVSIHDNLDSITLGFFDDSYITFEGFVLRSNVPMIGCNVVHLELSETHGFKGITLLRYLGKDIDKYSSLFLEFSGSKPEWKRELVCLIKRDTFSYNDKNVKEPHSRGGQFYF